MHNQLLNKIRLTQEELLAIQQAFQATFLPEDHLWLFGSRTDKNKKGGDIDLYIETNVNDLNDVMEYENRLVLMLWEKIGEQKIDVVINILADNKQLPIYSIAKKSGVQLI